MIRLIYCVSKRADVSTVDFRKWSHESYEPQVKRIVEFSGAREYKMSTTLVVEANKMIMEKRGTDCPHDAVLEIWWDNAAHLPEMMSSPEGDELRNAWIEGETAFMDHGRSQMFFTEA